MSVYSVALFLHIVGAFGLIAALAVEAVSLRGMRQAHTAEDARPWLTGMRLLRLWAPASIGLILVMGLYLMASAWGWRGWILTAFGGLFLVGLTGGLVTGRRMARLGPAVGRANGPLGEDVYRMIHDPALLISSNLRIALVVGILFLMTAKPSAVVSVAALGVAAAMGLGISRLSIGQVSVKPPEMA
jgi:hypothetical protein